MDKTIYSTRDEAIGREIIPAIEANGVEVASADEYDIDAIADQLLDWCDGIDTLFPLNHRGYIVKEM